MKHKMGTLATVVLATLVVTAASAQEKVRIAVGGKSAVFYLPLSVAERLDAFKEALPIYIKALTVSKPMYSPDGHFEPGAVGTAYAVLRVFDPAVAAATFDLSKTYDDRFVKQAASVK
jgi:hypothetical protein